MKPSFGVAKPKFGGVAIKKAESALASATTVAPPPAAAPAAEARNQTLAPLVRRGPKVATAAARDPPPGYVPTSARDPPPGERRPQAPRIIADAGVVESKGGEEENEEVDLVVEEKPVAVAAVAAAVVAGPGPILDNKAFRRDEATSVKAIIQADPIGIKPEGAIFRPITAPSFRRFIVETFLPYSPTLTRIKRERSDAFTKVPKEFNRNACKERPDKLETFYYQKLVRDYMAKVSPYRGLLVYHGLGTGKTCTSIAAAEALHYGGTKTIYILTPATLSPNFKKELGKCGFFPLNIQNHWAFLSVADPSNTKTLEFIWLRDILGLSTETIQKQRGGWVPNPAKPVNWETLSSESKKAILQQQDEHMHHRFRFIHYNGITPDSLSRLAMSSFREGKALFDDSVVIIDEIHNLVRTVNGTKLGSRPTPAVIEEIEPREFTWTQRLGRERIGFRYPRGYALYRLLQNAVGCKFMALSATPMINYAQELAILMNMIGGEIRVLEISLKSMDRSPATSTRLMQWAKAHPEIDFCAIEENEVKDIILSVTPVPYGFKKVVGEDYSTRGFVRVEGAEAVPVQASRERNMDRWAVSLLQQMEANAFLTVGGSVASAEVVATARAALDESTAKTLPVSAVAAAEEVAAEEVEEAGGAAVAEEIEGAAAEETGGAAAAAPAAAPVAPSVIAKKKVERARTRFEADRSTVSMLSQTPQFRIRTLPLLPEKGDAFVQFFVDPMTLQILYPDVLKARISGLVSYYKGGSEELMPRVGRNELVRVPMADHMFAGYIEAREEEIDKEKKSAGGGEEEYGAAPAKAVGRAMTRKEMDLYTQATKSPNTGFKSATRAACNYVFPTEVKRPKISDKQRTQILGIDKPRTIAVDRGDYIAGKSRASAAVGEGEGEEAAVADADADLEEPVEAVEPALSAELSRIVGGLMSGLEANAAQFLNKGLPEYSAKYVAMIENIRASPGPVLVYSNFKSLEGLGIFAAALRASAEGWLPIELQKTGDGQWGIPTALLGPSTMGRPRYIMYTGDQELDKRRLLLQLYNADLVNLPPLLKAQCQQLLAGAPDNRDGRVCRAFMITQSGAEGISMLNTRQVHLMEPYWNNVRIQQVIGRAIRLCSHMNLPWDDRVVDIFTYVSVFTDDQKATKAKQVMMSDRGKTTDENILDIAINKQKLADGLFEITQAAAIDCELHFHEHGAVTQCVKYPKTGGPTFAYHPDWKVDVRNSPMRAVYDAITAGESRDALAVATATGLVSVANALPSAAAAEE
jgi:hypothetical protein